MKFITDFDVEDSFFRLYYEPESKMFVIENRHSFPKKRRKYSAHQFAEVMGKYMDEKEMVELNMKISDMV